MKNKVARLIMALVIVLRLGIAPRMNPGNGGDPVEPCRP